VLKIVANLGGTPILLLKEGAQRTEGRDAQRNNIAAAKVIAEAVRTSLGPKGMDKMLVDSFGDVVITNDGATILKEIDVQHPTAKMVVELAKTQDVEVGDGTTTVVVLAGELLKAAETLLDLDVHPTVLVEGYRKATDKTLEILDGFGIPVNIEDTAMLKNIAMTAMGSKMVAYSSDYLADLAVKACKQVATQVDGTWKVDIDNIAIQKQKGESLEDTELINGIVMDKEMVHPGMPKIVRDTKIALLSTALEITKTEFDSKINITDPTQMQAFLDQEEDMIKEMVDKLSIAGANVVLCQKGMDDIAQHFLAKAGIAAIRRVKKSDIEKLAKATGGRIVSNLDELLPEDLGEAALVEERKISDENMVFVEGCKNPGAVSLLIRGGTELIVDEADRAIHDALCVVRTVIQDAKVVPGGGAPEIEIARGLRDYARSLGGREQLAVNNFADAVEIIPRSLAENAGLDPIDSLVQLRADHDQGNTSYGVNTEEGGTTDMAALNIFEPLAVKKQAIKSASEAAQMILRIDDVIAASDLGAGPGGPPGGMPDMGDEDF
jgi:thermosome